MARPIGLAVSATKMRKAAATQAFGLAQEFHGSTLRHGGIDGRLHLRRR